MSDRFDESKYCGICGLKSHRVEGCPKRSQLGKEYIATFCGHDLGLVDGRTKHEAMVNARMSFKDNPYVRGNLDLIWVDRITRV